MQQHQGQHSHQVLAQALGVTRSGFYAWRKSQGSHSPRKQAQQSLDEAVATCFRLSKGRYGAERLLVDLTEQNRYHDIKELCSFLVYGIEVRRWRILLVDHHDDHNQQKEIRHAQVYIEDRF